MKRKSHLNDSPAEKEKEGSPQDQEGEETNEDEMKMHEEHQEEEDNFKDKYFRLLADMENMRKRMQKEKQDVVRFATSGVIEEFLSPLDSFGKALECTRHASGEVQNWAQGFQMILRQFEEVLENHGVVSFSPFYQPFDPHLHEVIETEESSEHPENIVIQVFVKGYKRGDYVIRPARVKISVSPKLTPSEETENTQEGINEHQPDYHNH